MFHQQKKINLALIVGLLFSFIYIQKSLATEPPRYDIQATINTDQKKIHALEKVSFTNNSQNEITDLFFHIYPNRKFNAQQKEFAIRYTGYFKADFFPGGFPLGQVHFQSVSQAGQPRSYKIEGEDQTLLKVSLSKPIKPGETVEVDMDFTVDIPHAYGRFGWHENIFALSHWYPILSVYGNDGWHNYPFYPFHRPFFSESAYYNLELTVPKDQVVIHAGHLKEERPVNDNTKLLLIATPFPIREFSLAMSPDYRLYEEEWDGIQLKSFYLPGDEFHGKVALKSAKDLFQYYTNRFGKYPYSEFSIAPVYLGYGGEQMANLAFIDTRVYQLPKILMRYFDFLISHETGHQWFYNLVGIDEYKQIWLEEGVHSHFILEYLENKYGVDTNVVEFPKWFKNYEWILPNFSFRRSRTFRYQTIARIGYDRSVVSELSSFHEPSSIFSLTYGKGSRIVEMLEAQIGQEKFDKVFERIFKEYQFKNLDIQNFIRICQEESGQDLKPFFDQWLYTDKQLDYAAEGGKGAYGNAFVLVNRGQITMPVDIEVTSVHGEKIYLKSDGMKSREVMEIKDPIKKVIVDPEQKLLDIDLTNNSWPRQVNIKPVPIYLGLYDIPIFLPEDKYNFVFGPEIADNGLGLKASFQKPYDQNFYAATDYEFGEQLHHSRAGYQINNLFQTQTSAGFEISNTTDLDNGDEDLVSGKVFMRRELWPAAYGLGAINDHVTLYLIRNRELGTSLLFSGQEDTRNVSYLRKNEAIVGAAFHLGRSGPYPDPKVGFELTTLFESSNHILEATQYFYRAGFDLSFYQPVTPKTKLAYRLKYGWGFPDDRKTIRGSNATLESIEYRFPLRENIHWSFFDHILGVESVSAVAFYDGGQSWFDDFREGKFKQDAGLGLRFTVNLGSFLEKAILRADVAQPIDAPKEDIHFWFGVNHAF